MVVFSEEIGMSNGRKQLLWLLLIPFVALLWPPLYNSVQPELLGIPFYYWYQLLWVFIGAGITVGVYRAVR